MRRALFFLCAALWFSAPCRATSAQDSWYTPNESGWGLQVVQEGNAIGFALFVYDQNQNPTWYLGSGTGNVSSGWSGQMFSYRGPYFVGTFNQGAVASTPVGSFTFRLDSVQNATLTYTINNVSVTKQVQRLAAAGANIEGSYLGALVYRNYDCTAPVTNPAGVESANIVVTQTASSVLVRSTTATGTCAYSGTYAQQGRYGRIAGNLSCSGGVTGTFVLFEVDSNTQGFTGRYTATVNAPGVTCSQQGRIGGLFTYTDF